MISKFLSITRKPSISSASDVGDGSIQLAVRLLYLRTPDLKLTRVSGLSVHMTQVHKETLTIIDNALPNRSGLEVEIFGMEGIPEDVTQAHNQRVLQNFAQAEAERRAATGNVGPGGAAGQVKKPKFESPSDLKKRLAEHKAKKAAEEATGISSGGNTPAGMGHGSQSPGVSHSPGAYVSKLTVSVCFYLKLRTCEKVGSPGFPQPQVSYGAPPNTPGYSSVPQPYGQQPPPFQQQQQSPMPPQQSPFSPPGQPQFQNSQGFPPPQQYQPPGGPGFQPGFQNGLPSNFSSGPPSQFQNGPPSQFQNGPPPQFQNGPPQFQNGPQPFQSGPPQLQNGPHQFQNGPPQQFSPGPPGPPFQQQNQFQPPRTHTPPQQNIMPQRPSNLPPAPGLPQRPAFGAPPVNAFQMQQMHQGQVGGPPNPVGYALNGQQNAQQKSSENVRSPGGGPVASFASPPGQPPAPDVNMSSLDDLVSGTAKDADKAAATAKAKTEAPKAQEPQEEKKSKKEKDKNMKLMYSDNEVSPEEKMAKMARYAFAPSGK